MNFFIGVVMFIMFFCGGTIPASLLMSAPGLPDAVRAMLLLSTIAVAEGESGFMYANAPITITGYATAGAYTKGNFNDLAMWDVMEELTGITICFESAPSGQSGEKIGLLFASNKLPDVLMKVKLGTTEAILQACA